MKRFSDLFFQLDRTNKTNEKVELVKAYFLSAPEEDKIWALALFTGRRPSRVFKSAQVTEWAIEQAGIPFWLFRESYGSVGDMAETISLILPASVSSSDRSLSDLYSKLAALKRASDEEKKEFIIQSWKQLSPYEVFVFNKLLMGSFRIGVSQTLVVRAVGEVTHQEPSVISHRVMGDWNPYETTFHDLIQSENIADQLSRPYPFYLAYAIEDGLESLGAASDWFAEWKWDGIRSQVIVRNRELYIWSRGEELVTDKFPELHILKDHLPDGTVLDGEILCFADERPLPFNVLQTRIGRKNVTKKILAEAPVAFIGYDILEYGGQDIRTKSQQERRRILEQVFEIVSSIDVFRLSRLLTFTDWEELKKLHTQSRDFAAEGFMLKRK